MSGLLIHHKPNFHIVRWIAAIVIVVFIAAYSYFGIRWYNTGIASPFPIPVASADTSIDEQALSDTEIAKHTVKPFEPRYIAIPILGLSNTRVQKTGLTDSNLLEVPANLNDAGWFEKSSTPGSGVGAIVMTGHNGGVSRTGAFSKFGELQIDDQIIIQRGDDEQYTYLIRDISTIGLAELTSEKMSEIMQSVDPDKEGLTLVTSSGNWIPRQKVFDKRIIIRAVIAE